MRLNEKEKMPVSRNYGGYSAYTPYQPPATVYATSYSSYHGGRFPSTPGTASGDEAAAHATSTPGMRSLYGAYGVLAGSGGGSGYKYLTRDWLNDEDDDGAAGAARRTINTEDLDVDTDRGLERRHAIPGAIKRDTAADLGERGKQVVRIVTARQRNSFARKDDGTQELTLGQRLALKHLLVDPKKDGVEDESTPPTPKPFVRRSSLAHMTTPRVAKLIREEEEQRGGEGSSDEWTWETCSSSEEGPDVKYFPPTPPSEKKRSSTSSYNRAKTTDLSGALSRLGQESQAGDIQATPKTVDGSSSSRQSLDRWSRAMFSEKKDRKPNQGSISPASFSSGKTAATAKPPSPSARLVEAVASTSDAAEKMTTMAKAANASAVTIVPTEATITKSMQEKSSDAPAAAQLEKVKVTPQNVAIPEAKPKSTLDVPSSCSTFAGRGTSPTPSSTHSEDSGGDNVLPSFVRTFKCPGMQQFSSDEEEGGGNSGGGGGAATFSRGWRKGQPPRSDVVVKLTSKAKDEVAERKKRSEATARKMSEPVISYNHSRTMNKLLTSSLDLSSSTEEDHQVQQVRQEEKKQERKAATRMTIEIEDRAEQVASMRKVKEEPSQALREEPVTTVEATRRRRKPPAVVDRIVENVTQGGTVVIKANKERRPLEEEIELKIVEPPQARRKKKSLVKVSIVQSESDSGGGSGEKVVQAKMEFSLRGENEKREDGSEEEAMAAAAAVTVAHALDEVISKVVSAERKLEMRKMEESLQQKKEVEEINGDATLIASAVQLKGDDSCPDVAEAEVKVERERKQTTAEAARLPDERSTQVMNKASEGRSGLGKDLEQKQTRFALPSNRVIIHQISFPPKIAVTLLDSTGKNNDAVKVEKIVMSPKKKAIVAATDRAKREMENNIMMQPQPPEKPPKKKAKKLKAEAKKKDQKGGGEKKNKKVVVGSKAPSKVPEEKPEEDDKSSQVSDASEVPLTATQLERLPSPMRNLFELKSKAAAGEEVSAPPRRDPPEGERPKYWDNVPAPCDPAANPMLQLANMREEARRHREKVMAEQEAALDAQDDAADQPWYDEESEETRDQLRDYERRPSNHHKPESERRTPEENMAIVRLYGGAQFPGGDPGETRTPRRLLIGGDANKRRKKQTNGIMAGRKR